MSYIEREPLLEILNGLYDHHLTMHNYAADGATQDCIEAVIEAPTADVAEVRHGEWGFDGIGWTCSECGEYALSIKTKLQSRSKYCPNCGAKMKGE